MIDPILTDQDTATAALKKIAGELAVANQLVLDINMTLRAAIVRIRPTGVLSVGQMAEAVGSNRNRIDSIWSIYGDSDKQQPTRIPALAPEGQASLTAEYRELYHLAQDQKRLTAEASVLRSMRDRTVTMVYASKILGPTAIAAAADIDRNHTLRLARKAGVTPAHRTVIKNQYSTS